jgi:hypothetical protein
MRNDTYWQGFVSVSSVPAESTQNLTIRFLIFILLRLSVSQAGAEQRLE